MLFRKPGALEKKHCRGGGIQKESFNLNVLNKNHPEHQQFLEVLQNPIFSKYELISDFLFDFNEKMVSFYKN